MELKEMDIKQLFSIKTNLNETTISIILYNMLQALNFIHSANVIHRDLKPSNFLIDSYSRVMICDFGMARVMPKLSQD